MVNKSDAKHIQSAIRKNLMPTITSIKEYTYKISISDHKNEKINFGTVYLELLA